MSAQNAQSGNTNSGASQEFVVRIPKNVKKRYNVMRFHGSLNLDIAKWTQVKMERENNLKDFKAEEEMPKFGAGSEYGREQREEARRKKYGINIKKYNPEEQPWLLKMGGKAGKKYRGIREGGITDNSSYYVFVKAPDGAFEAFQIEEWYNFTPVQRYKTLNAEEAEEEFGRRDKVLNYFTIMTRKRLVNEEENDKDEEVDKLKKKKKDSKYGTGSSDLKISDMDEWIHSSEEESEEEGIAEATETQKNDNKKKTKDNKKKKKKKKKDSSDEEAEEESDDGDDEGREVDYISDESSSSEDERQENMNKELKGVEDEEAIRKMEESDSEEDNPEEKKENAEENKDEPSPNKANKEKKEQKKTDGGSSSESSSDSSDSDDFDTSFQSPLFVPKSKRNKDSPGGKSSRPDTPTRGLDSKKDQKGQKRKANSAQNSESGITLPSKKSKTLASSLSSSAPTPTSSTPAVQTSAGLATSASTSTPRPPCDLASEGITEECVKRYLMRKPMTTTELLQKFKSKKTSFSREQLVNTLAQILKRLDPERKTIKGKMFLSIKQT